MENESTFTPFDRELQSRELMIFKTMIPYLMPGQQRMFALMIKFMELQKTASLFNGKTKATVTLAKDVAKDEALAAGKAALGDKLTGNIIKEIYVPGKIINIVAK